MSDITDRARELLKEIHKWYFKDYCEKRQMFLLTSALQRERDEAADRNCTVCERFYTETECGGTKERPYQPNHCRFRAAILADQPKDARDTMGGGDAWVAFLEITIKTR